MRTTQTKPEQGSEGAPGLNREEASPLGNAVMHRMIQRRVLQRKADKEETKEPAGQPGKPEVLTITDRKSYIRGDDLKPTKEIIPPGTRVEIVDRKDAG